MQDQATKKPPGARFWVSIGVIVVVALLIRFYAILADIETYRYGAGGFGDTHYYHRLAYHLVQGKGYSAVDDPAAYGGTADPALVYEPAISRGPLYPAFLAVVYKVRGVPDQLAGWAAVWRTARLTQAVLDSLVCLAVATILTGLEPKSRWPATIGALLYALNPYSIYYCQELLGESVTIAVMALFLLALVRTNLTDSWRWATVAGIALALVVLSRTEFVLFLIPSTAILAALTWPKKHVAGAFFAAFTAIMLCWTLANGKLTGRYRPTPDAGVGYALFHGSFQTNSNWAGWNQYPADLPVSSAEREELLLRDKLLIGKHQEGRSAKEHDAFFLAMAKKQLRERPLSVMACWFVRLPRLWYQCQIQMYPKPEPSGNLLLLYLAFGVVAMRHYRLRTIWPLPAIMLYLTLVFIPLFVESRYSTPTLPATISLAALGIHAAFRKSQIA